MERALEREVRDRVWSKGDGIYVKFDTSESKLGNVCVLR